MQAPEKLSAVATLRQDDRIAILTIDSPPVNALSQAVRQSLLDAIATVDNDDSLDALVIRCAGRTFFPGADVREFDQPPSDPTLPQIVNALEQFTKPVIAAIHGTALGGGLEVAMGCHLRVAADGAKLGLPEVKMGVIPGAGGTQRLPRLVGVSQALKMIAEGDPITATEAARVGLVDRVVADSELLDAAVRLARDAVSGKVAVKRTGARQPETAGDEVFEIYLKSNARKIGGQHAPRAAVEVLRRGLQLPFAEAVAFERKKFLELRAGEQSKALRHVFFAERAAADVPGITADTPALTVTHVGIVGAGTMGSGIAINFLLNGMDITLVEQQASALERGVDNIKRTIERNVASGRTRPQDAERALSRLRPSLKYEDLAQADLIIEAAFETMEVKRAIFGKLDQVARQDAILATNTSYLDIDEIAAVTSRPAQVLGLHFFSPANIMKLVEVVRTAHTSNETLATALKVARAIGKIPVVCGVCYGFIGNRMLAVYREGAEQALLSGASVAEVDRVAESFGFAMGPFRVRDLAGLDLGWSRETSKGATLRERLCEMDRRGQKTHAGFYDYDAERRPSPSPLVEQLIRDFARERGIEQRTWTAREILDRMLLPMIYEGKKILAEGIALRASDIDVVWIHGYGWPRWTGGPMHYGEHRGG